MSRFTDWLLGIPANHRFVVNNTKASYPWLSNLRIQFAWRGYETESGEVETVWLFLWEEPEYDVYDVALVGTLRVYDHVWSWEFARMDGGAGGLQVMVKVFDEMFEDLFVGSEVGYRSVTGICQ